MSLGPIMLDVVGTTLTAEDIRRLQHPLVGGVILFKRNYENNAQLDALTASIHAVRQPPLLIAVDHEGAAYNALEMDLLKFHLCVSLARFGTAIQKRRKNWQ